MNLFVVVETGVVIFVKEDWSVTGREHTDFWGSDNLFLDLDGGYVSGSLCEVLLKCTLVV